MKLKTLSNWFSLLVIGAFCANLVSIGFLIHANGKIDGAYRDREQALQLTHDLRLETERLARLVRAYTTTADPRYLLFYYDILDIRNGNKPLPAGESASLYWDEVIAGKRSHTLPNDGQKISLAQRLSNIGGSAEEMSVLMRFQYITEQMNRLEQVAFAATQGLYDKKARQFVSDGEPDLKFAASLVHGKEYSQLEAQLSQAVVDLVRVMNQRTHQRVEVAHSSIRFWQWVSAATILFGLILISMAFHLIRARVLNPIDELESEAKKLGSGDYTARLGNLRGVDELITLEKTFDSMAQAIELDIQNREQMLTELQQARKQAEAATEAKSFFLASMSHEIRTPLNGVIGMLRFALCDEQLQPETRRKVRLALSSGESLLTIINDILDFSKIEAGKLTIESIDFEFLSMVFDGLETISELAGNKGLGFVVNVDENLPRYFRGDPTRIRQVLVNLAGNAIKFTQHGQIVVSAQAEMNDGAQCRVRFKVQDSGIGISAEGLSRLFQRFQQADDSTSRRFGGTGLGLVICRQLVEAMGGEIGVSSELGVGTTFEFVLTLPLGVAPVLEDLQPQQQHPHRLKVLCAEDVQTNQIIIQTLLEEMGHEVTLVENGRLAVEALAQQRYDVVLMDGHMPEMDGLEATRAIRAGGLEGLSVLDPQVMIVALTANVTDEHEKQFLAAGMDAFLTKPIEQKALYAVLERAIARLDAAPSAPLLPAAAPVNDTRARLRDAVLKSLPDKLVQLDRALQQRHLLELGTLVNGIKASATFLGDENLQALASDLEHAVTLADWVLISDGCRRLRLRLEPAAG
jgi:two-component system sensor histidine kinase/response regulator